MSLKIGKRGYVAPERGALELRPRIRPRRFFRMMPSPARHQPLAPSASTPTSTSNVEQDRVQPGSWWRASRTTVLLPIRHDPQLLQQVLRFLGIVGEGARYAEQLWREATDPLGDVLRLVGHASSRCRKTRRCRGAYRILDGRVRKPGQFKRGMPAQRAEHEERHERHEWKAQRFPAK